jgi:hypothetical protein
MKLSDRLLDSPVQTAMDKTNPAMSAPLTPLYNLSLYNVEPKSMFRISDYMPIARFRNGEFHLDYPSSVKEDANEDSYIL